MAKSLLDCRSSPAAHIMCMSPLIATGQASNMPSWPCSCCVHGTAGKKRGGGGRITCYTGLIKPTIRIVGLMAAMLVVVGLCSC